MILSFFIYLIDILHNKNIVMMWWLVVKVTWCGEVKVRCKQNLTILNQKADIKCFKVIILY